MHLHIIIDNILTTQCSMGENAFHLIFQEIWVSPTCHQILPSPLRGSGQDTVKSWEKTPSLLENHVKCISSPSSVTQIEFKEIVDDYFVYLLHNVIARNEHTSTGFCIAICGVEPPAI